MGKNSSEESLFSEQALIAKKEKYGKIINPIGKFPSKYLALCFLFVTGILWFGFTHKFERHITLEGTTILKNKPSRITNNYNGYISSKLVNNGDFVESDQALYKIKSSNDNTCLLEFENDCKKELLIKSKIAGFIEQFYMSAGDYVSVNDTMGLIVPHKNHSFFELYLPINLNEKVFAGMTLEVEIVNPYKSQTRKVESKITYKSRIPVNKKNSRYYFLEAIPVNNNETIPVGAFVTFKILDSSKTIFELIKKQ